MADLAHEFVRTAGGKEVFGWSIARKTIASISTFLKTRRDMRLLASMTDAQLKDIGISRSMIEKTVHTEQLSQIKMDKLCNFNKRGFFRFMAASSHKCSLKTV